MIGLNWNLVVADATAYALVSILSSLAWFKIKLYDRCAYNSHLKQGEI